MKTEFTNRDFQHIENCLEDDNAEGLTAGEPYTSKEARMHFVWECRKIVDQLPANTGHRMIAYDVISEVLELLDGKRKGTDFPRCVVTTAQPLTVQQYYQEGGNQYYADETELNPGDEMLADAFRKMMQERVPQTLL